MTHLDDTEITRKLQAIERMSLTHRDMMHEAAGYLPDLSPQALEFLLDVIEQLRPHRASTPLDPMPAIAVAAAKYRKRRRQD